MSKQALSDIRKNPDKYCVCNGCGSILRNRGGCCTNCNAYNPDATIYAVLKAAEEIARRGFGRNCVTEDDLK